MDSVLRVLQHSLQGIKSYEVGFLERNCDPVAVDCLAGWIRRESLTHEQRKRNFGFKEVCLETVEAKLEVRLTMDVVFCGPLPCPQSAIIVGVNFN